ncbi:type II toxin-antitoxin system RelE/ParE family toxin [Luteimonas sp. MC1828]|uniref:type II toxin-antitoxin system RelE/ParE family toxin n=1 Tax=Luteimonas sp. MC1828 TaxID=2799787 RepID=UPI0018F14190|nr:type II toxin-antitoxin system RelE/ParE family toxin [Luteimonas sp. MC1828]MBJ7575407.1 type II toxin-antitoxin system RelE/ParE family toxin [Luteimonas sp. MC1828]
MSHASRQADAVARARSERLQRGTAVVLTALLHLLALLLALSRPPVPVAPPEGSSGGGDALQVTWIDEAPPSPAPAPPAPPVATPAPRKAPPRPARAQPIPVVQGEDPVQPAPPVPLAAAAAPAQAAVESPVPPTQRPAQLRGQPPGMRLEDLARASAGPSRRPAVNRGRGNAARASGVSLEVDGYQVLYEPLGEARLREWRDQGMTELFLPLPGTHRYMVCALEIVVRRGSGPCRMVEPDAPELATIGDARQVILMQRVYRLGDEVWSGPGPYR